jgi:hypothetical protein
VTANGTTAAQLAGIHDVLQRLAAVAQQEQAPQLSVELSRNAKGQTQVTVKVYSPIPGAAADQAQQLYDALVARYAMPEASA